MKAKALSDFLLCVRVFVYCAWCIHLELNQGFSSGLELPFRVDNTVKRCDGAETKKQIKRQRIVNRVVNIGARTAENDFLKWREDSMFELATFLRIQMKQKSNKHPSGTELMAYVFSPGFR